MSCTEDQDLNYEPKHRNKLSSQFPSEQSRLIFFKDSPIQSPKSQDDSPFSLQSSLNSFQSHLPAPLSQRSLFNESGHTINPSFFALKKQHKGCSSPHLVKPKNTIITGSSQNKPYKIGKISFKAEHKPNKNTNNDNPTPLLAKEYNYRRIDSSKFLSERESINISREDSVISEAESPSFSLERSMMNSMLKPNANLWDISSRKHRRGNTVRHSQDNFPKCSSFASKKLQAEKLKLSRLDTDSSSDEDNEAGKPLSHKKIRLRKILRRTLLVGYFIGVMFSLRSKIKVFGTLRPIEHYENLEMANKNSKKKHGIFPILPTNSFSLFWTMFIIVFLLTSAIMTPVYVSFIDQDNHAFYYLNLIFDAGFGIDICITFVSAYYDDDDNLVTDYKKIALNYLQGWFWVDFASILPIDDIVQSVTQGDKRSGNNSTNLLKLLRFPRLYRMVKIFRLFRMIKLFTKSPFVISIIKQLNLNISAVKVLKLFVSFTFLNHLVGCLWFFVARLYDVSPDTWAGKAGLSDADVWTQYVASIYWAFQTLTTVGYGDLSPGTRLERIICTLWPIICITVYTFLVGTLASIVLTMNRQSERLQDRIASFKLFASDANLPDFLRQKVQRFFELNHKENMYHWVDSKQFLKGLPIGLKTNLLLFSYYSLIKDTKILQVNANFTAALLVHLKIFQMNAHETLYREDDPANEIFFILEGTVKFTNEKAENILSMAGGTYFGEIEVFDKVRRQFFCQTLSSTTLLVCPKDAFINTLRDYPVLEAQVMKIMHIRKTKLRRKVMKIRSQALKRSMDKDASDPESSRNKKMLSKTTEHLRKFLKPTEKPKKEKIGPRRELNLLRPAPPSQKLIQSHRFLRKAPKKDSVSRSNNTARHTTSLNEINTQVNQSDFLPKKISRTLVITEEASLEGESHSSFSLSPLKTVKTLMAMKKFNEVYSLESTHMLKDPSTSITFDIRQEKSCYSFEGVGIEGSSIKPSDYARGTALNDTSPAKGIKEEGSTEDRESVNLEKSTETQRSLISRMEHIKKSSFRRDLLVHIKREKHTEVTTKDLDHTTSLSSGIT